MARARPSSPPDPLDRLVGEAPAMQTLRAQITHLARFDAVGSATVPTVLLQGETGTGKGLVARLLHDSGPRAQGPFIEVNCAAIPDTLLEAELFGVEAGAFTDAKRPKPGLFEAASGGTLFLDEIAALPLVLQGKLLTAIEAKRVRRLGAVTEHSVDVKLIAATQSELSGPVQAGHFRADLYHRLAVVVLDLPPLRARGDDILVLARAFLQRYCAAYGAGPRRLSTAAAEWLIGQPWPGNVRELSHLLERAVLLEQAMVIDPASLARLCLPQQLPEMVPAAHPAPTPVAPANEPERLAEALRQSGGNLAAAARLLGLSRGGLRHRLHKHGLTRASIAQSPPPVREEHDGQDTPATPTAHFSLAPTRRAEPPWVGAPEPLQDQSEPAVPEQNGGPVGQERDPSTEPAGWASKPVAVLAIEATWPGVSESVVGPYEPWTVAHRWEQCIAEKVAGFGGVILQGSASLLLVAFGLPQTLEQLPQRAIQAALAIRRLAAAVEPSSGGLTGPVVRLAGHLGTLLVAEGMNEPTCPWLALGETLSLPVRLLGHAAPGEVLVTSPMARLTDGWVELLPRALSAGAEATDQLLAHTVVGLFPHSVPRIRIARRSRTPFLGRARELATLQAALDQVTSGRGQVVGIVGEPGMGKSRLLTEWRQDLGRQEIAYLEGHCWSYASAMPYLPILDLLRAQCGITTTDTAEDSAEKIYATLQAVGLRLEDGAPYLLNLLGIQVGTERLVSMDREGLKAKTFTALQQIILHSSRRQPLVIAVENLHWIDPTSEAFLARLVDSIIGARMLILTTYRPGYRPPWLEKSYATQLTLQPLSAQDSREVIGAVLQTHNLPEALAQTVVIKAQGNPFFLEELAQTLVEQAPARREGESSRPSTLHLPATVQGVLAARIDRLPPAEKALLQTLAVIGHVCTQRILMRVMAESEAEVLQHLTNLQAAELLYEQPSAPEPIVVFKHVLTQEAAYHSLSQARQREIHERTGRAIEELVGERLSEYYGELAHHYSRSDNAEKAVAYLRRAGQQASDRSAFREAIMPLTQGLALLRHLPNAQERVQQELDLQITLGQALMVFKGQASQEAEHAFTRACELCQQLGETPQLFEVLAGLRLISEARGELPKARDVAEQLLHLAKRLQDPARLMRAHRVLGGTLFYLGAFAPAHASLDRAIALDPLSRDRSAAVRLPNHIQGGSILGVSCRRHVALALWYLGYPERALERSHEAIALALELAHPYSLAYALYFATQLHCLRREAPTAQAQAEALIALARQQDFPAREVRGIVLRGWALAAQGQTTEGIAQMCQGMDAHRSMGSNMRPYDLTLLATAYGWIGQTTEALGLLAEALALTHRCGGHFYQAETHRLTGEILLMQDAGGGVSEGPALDLSMREGDDGEGPDQSPRQTEAETCFRQALDIARRQQAKSLELRAAMSLSQLWQRQGKQAEARELLGPIYDWFTEGFDTADLQEAKALLEVLA